LRNKLSLQEDAVNRFIANHADRITGVLSGFDRVVFRGTLRPISFVDGLKRLLWKNNVLLKDFGPYAQRLTTQLREASLRAAQAQHRPVQYLRSADIDKEAVARQIMERDGITSGLICVLTAIEPCTSFEVYRNRDAKRLELVSRFRKGLSFYHYLIDPVFGFMNARIQSWLPFTIQICLNGREWLARMMDKTRLAYRRRDNCFTRLEDVAEAQALMNQQIHFAWTSALDHFARMLNPAHRLLFKHMPMDYYWTAHQTEWATDVMFKDSGSLAAIYPALVLHGMTAFSSPDVMRFLGRKVHGAFQGEIISDFKNRPEGVRIKHRVGQNSVKLYDKQGSVLRVETTINQTYPFKVFRHAEDDPSGPKDWLPMRKGIADLHRRARISQASNHRYLDALASVDTATPLGELVRNICQPVIYHDKRVRALHPWSAEDTRLFEAVSRGEFAVNGFRNRDLQALLYDSPADSPEEKRRRSAKVSRLLRMLRAHGLIRKVNATHRYTLTSNGRDILTAILATHKITLQKLHRAAA
jgi:hypothetical protein